MLSPEAVAQLRGQAGLSATPPAPTPSGAPSGSDIIAQRKAALGMTTDTTPTATPTQNPFPGSLGDIQKPAPTAQPFKNGLSTIDTEGKYSKALITGALPGVEGFGNEVAAAIGAPSAQADADKANVQKSANLEMAIKARNKLQASGHDTTHADQMIRSLLDETSAKVSDVLPAVNDTSEQVMGNAASIATDIIGAGALPGAANAAAGAGVVKGALAGAKLGAGFGAVQGAAGAMANNKNAAGVVGSGIVGGLEGGVSGAVLGGTIAGVSKALTPKDPVAVATHLISQDAETMTQGMKNEAVDQGRMVETSSKGGNIVSYKPTTQIERAGKIMADPAEVPKPIVAGDKSSVVLAKVKSAISSKGEAAETYLNANPEYVSNKESADMIETMKQKASRVLEPHQMDAYNNQLDLFQKQLEDQTAKSGTLNTSDYYLALKSYEKNIGNQISRGKDAIIDPTGVGSARIRAASDIRSTIRDMIGQKHPEFAPKMQDISSLYEARDNAAFNAAKTDSKTIFEKHPTATKVAKYGAIGIGGAVVGAPVVNAVKSVIP